MREQIPNVVKDERSKIIMEQSDKFEHEFIKEHEGRTRSVLYEKGKDQIYTGFTPEYIKIKVKSKTDLQGQILPTKLVEGRLGFFWGEI